MKHSRWWQRIKTRDLVFFTLPLLLLVLYIYASAVARTAKAREFDDWWSRPKDIYRYAGYQIRGWFNLLPALAAERRLDAEIPDASALRLDLPRSAWDRVSLDPLSTFGVDYPASLLDGGTFHPIKLRVRGDTSAHWTTEKVSFTLRTKRGELWRGHRRIGYTCKRVLPLYLAATLAREFDLLAPASHLSPVFFNDRFYGLYRALEIPDESFLRRAGQLPGNIFRGDTAERGEVFKNLPRPLFRNPYIWDLVASDGKPEALARAELESLIRAVHDSSPGARERLLARFDLDEIGRFVALLMVVGDLHHISDLHNNFWYRDPSDARLHPIPWDVFVRSLHAPIGRANLMISALLREPEVMQRALRYVKARLEGGLSAHVEELVRGADARHADAFAYDRLRRGAISDVGEVADVLRLMRENFGVLEQWIDDARIASCATRDGETWVVDLSSGGFAAATLRGISFEGTAPGSVRVWADRNRNGVRDPLDPELPGSLSESSFELEAPIQLLPAADPSVLPLDTAPLHYRVFVEGSATAGTPRPVLHNALTGDPVAATPLAEGTPLHVADSWHPWDTEPVPAHFTVWRGRVRLDETRRFGEADTLTIRAGTTVELGPDVSLFSRGVVEVLGTAEEPVTFVRRDPDAPWGSIGLVGAGADGSRFTHCRFEEGGGATVEGIEFKGMVSAHRVGRVTFEHCEFRDNVRCDDMLNVVHSVGTVRNSRFVRAHGDAIDFDISTGTIANCVFESSRNDAIDLMTASPRILDNVIDSSGDKGISIGEDSDPLIFGNVIRNCVRGVEVKDASHPLLVHNRIEGNRTGIFEQRKNWRYGTGGFAVLVRSVIAGNDVDVEIGARSRLTNVGSLIGTPTDAMLEDEPANVIAHCVLAAAGIDAPTSEAGLPASWRERPAAAATETTFRADFDDLTDGWHATDRFARLMKRELDLELRLDEPAAMARPVQWDLAADQRHVLVVELALPFCSGGQVRVTHDGSEVVQPIEPRGGDEAGVDRVHFQMVAVELPPGRYEELALHAEPLPRQPARVLLHGYRIYSLPR